MLTGVAILLFYFLLYYADGRGSEAVSEKVKPQLSQEDNLVRPKPLSRFQGMKRRPLQPSSIMMMPRRPWTPPEDAVYGRVVYSPDTRLKRDPDNALPIRKSDGAQLTDFFSNAKNTSKRTFNNFQNSKPTDETDNMLRLLRSMPLNLMTWLRWQQPQQLHTYSLPTTDNDMDIQTYTATQAPQHPNGQQQHRKVSTVTGRQFGGLDDLEMELRAAMIRTTTQSPDVDDANMRKIDDLTETQRLQLHKRKKQERKRFLQHRVKEQIAKRRTTV